MLIASAAVRRPIAMSCLIIGLTLLGLNAWRKMNLELMPRLDVPFITILTPYPGASPGEIELDVARRIEDALMGVDGLKHIVSSCMENVSQTLLEFYLETDIDIAASDVREQIDLIRNDFPNGVEDPQILKFDINAAPIVTLALSGDHSLDRLYDYADNRLSDALAAVPGVAGVTLIGGAEQELVIDCSPTALASRGLTISTVAQALNQNLGVIPAGRVRSHGREMSVTFDSDVGSIEELADIPLESRDGTRVLLGDVATAMRLTSPELRQRAFLNRQEAIVVRIIKKADANALQVVQDIQEQLPLIHQRLPGGMELHWVTDDGGFIAATNQSAWRDVALGILLTALVLFFFLYNLRSLLVVTLTMPLTIVIGILCMHALGFTLNTSTLIAIGMSVGILVTNSIVVVEAIVSRLERCADAKEAARLGASESWIAVLASATTNMVVLLPLALMPSMVGRFIGPLATTMLIMTVVSLFISFTLTPLLCSVLLRAQKGQRSGLLWRMESLWNRGLQALTAGYRRLLIAHEERRWLALLSLGSVCLLFIGTLALAGRLGSNMVEDPDRGEIFVKLEYPIDFDLDATQRAVQRAEERLAQLPHLQSMLTTIGTVEGIIGQVSDGVYLAQILLRVSDRDQRSTSIADLLRQTRSLLADLPGVLISVSQPTMVGGHASDIELEIAGDDFAILDQTALAILAAGRRLPKLTEFDSTVRPGKGEIRVRPIRHQLADRGMASMPLGMLLRGNIEGIPSGRFTQQERSYNLRVRQEPQRSFDHIRSFPIPGEQGQPVGLETVTSISEGETPILITRKNKQRIAKVLANLEPGVALGTAVADLDALIRAEELLPPGYHHHFAGTYEAMAEAQEAMAEAGLIAMILVLLSLAAIVESFTKPLLILLTIPLALMGVIGALVLSGGSLGIFEMMGMVMLIGIVVNNAILIVDQLNLEQARGETAHRAMINAACARLRPILMITIAAILGMLPLALGRGLGSELRNGVGIAAIGGILASGLLTLLVLPIVYDLFARNRRQAANSVRDANASGTAPSLPASQTPLD